MGQVAPVVGTKPREGSKVKPEKAMVWGKPTVSGGRPPYLARWEARRWRGREAERISAWVWGRKRGEVAIGQFRKGVEGILRRVCGLIQSLESRAAKAINIGVRWGQLTLTRLSHDLCPVEKIECVS